jgi:hypothetical protein
MKYIITLENSIPAPMSRADRFNSSFVVPIRSGQAPSTDGDICFNSAEETGWPNGRPVHAFTNLVAFRGRTLIIILILRLGP